MLRTETITFHSIYTNYFRRSLLFVKSYVQDELAAEDIVSDSLIKLWEELETREDNNYLPLLITILRNRSLDYLRHERIKIDVHHSLAEISHRELDLRISTLEACDPEEIFSAEIRQLIRTALKSLPPQTRKIFELSRFENLSGKEIAEKLGLSVKSVEYHITRTLKVLRVTLKDYLPLIYFFIG